MAGVGVRAYIEHGVRFVPDVVVFIGISVRAGHVAHAVRHVDLVLRCGNAAPPLMCQPRWAKDVGFGESEEGCGLDLSPGSSAGSSTLWLGLSDGPGASGSLLTAKVRVVSPPLRLLIFPSSKMSCNGGALSEKGAHTCRGGDGGGPAPKRCL